MERVRLPVDVELEDRLAFGLTAKQLVILGLSAVVGYGVFSIASSVLPLAVAAAAGTPAALGGLALAFGRRDGMSGDDLARAALRHLTGTRKRLAAPEGMPEAIENVPSDRERISALDIPVRRVLRSGLIDLVDGGYALLTTATATSFALRSDEEQAALVEAYGRFLNSLVGPTAIAVRSERVQLAARADVLRQRAGDLPHPALRAAAVGHADFLAELDSGEGIRRRSVLLVLSTRERDRAIARTDLERRASEAADLLRGADVELHPLNGEQVGALLPQALDPEGPTGASVRLTGVVRSC
jgi:hypothetical protein